MGHTKGPWITQKLERINHPYTKERGMLEPYRILATPDSGCEEVAIIDGVDDARLIAAAPDLLEALLEIYRFGVDDFWASNNQEIMERAKAAITKATAQRE